jgi:plastocyanin
LKAYACGDGCSSSSNNCHDAGFGDAATGFCRGDADPCAAAAPTKNNTSNSSNSRLNAEAIYESNSVTADSDVEDLVIKIPDSSGDNGSKWQEFLPGSATVVSGTNVTWINADVNMTHGIMLSSGEDGTTSLRLQFRCQKRTIEQGERRRKMVRRMPTKKRSSKM